MISGLYTAASGMIAQTEQQDVTANNLANVNTAGYKKDTAVYVEFPKMFVNRLNDEKQRIPGIGNVSEINPLGAMGKGVQLAADGVKPQLTLQGAYIQTSNKLDMAIQGNAMFVVMASDGLRYTRNGNFTVDMDNRLVTQEGLPVLGVRGEIIIDGSEVFVDEGGTVYVDKVETDTLRLAKFDESSLLRKQGDSLFYALDKAPLAEYENEPGARVLHGYIEGSNVNVVKEMVSMITGYRAYEASQKAVQAQDQTLDKAVNSVGSISL